MALDMNVWEHAAEAALPPDLTAQLSKKNYFPQNASEDLRLTTSHETNGKADLRRGLALPRKFSLSILLLSIQNKWFIHSIFPLQILKIPFADPDHWIRLLPGCTPDSRSRREDWPPRDAGLPWGERDGQQQQQGRQGQCGHGKCPLDRRHR